MGDLQPHNLPPNPPPPAAKFASQGDAREKPDAQIKFLYYLLVTYIFWKKSENFIHTLWNLIISKQTCS